MMNHRYILGKIAIVLSRSDRLAQLARLIRNQADQVVTYYLNDDREHHYGEALVVEELGPDVRRFVDVGANRGMWTQSVLKHAPGAKGLLVEPGVEAVVALQDAFRGRANIEVLVGAAADEPGELTFFEEPGAGEGSSLLETAAQPGSVARTVKVVRLDDELDQRGWDAVDFVKVDAEGYDARVIAGLRRRIEAGQIGALQFEYNAQWAQAGSTLWPTLDLLERNGYETWLVRSKGLYRFRYERWGEFFRHTNFLAVHPRWTARVAPLVQGSV